jgi:hypothetical protein
LRANETAYLDTLALDRVVEAPQHILDSLIFIKGDESESPADRALSTNAAVKHVEFIVCIYLLFLVLESTITWKRKN